MKSLILLFGTFFKIGLFSFGGGNAMLPLIYQSMGELRGIGARGFSDMVALSQVTPGPVAVNAATYMGMSVGGIPGAFVATLGVSIPCFVIMILVIRLLDRNKGNKFLEGIFLGIRPVSIGLILSAVVFIAGGVLVEGSMISADMMNLGYYNLFPILVFFASIGLIVFLKIKPIYIMLIMAACGAIFYGFAL